MLSRQETTGTRKCVDEPLPFDAGYSSLAVAVVMDMAHLTA